MIGDIMLSRDLTDDTYHISLTPEGLEALCSLVESAFNNGWSNFKIHPMENQNRQILKAGLKIWEILRLSRGNL